MKGLFVKDLCFFRELVKTLVIFLIVATMMILFQDFKYENLMFVFSYMIVCSAMTSVNLIAYDQDQNGMSFLLTFPVKKKDYVRAKFLFSGFVILVVFAIMWMLSITAITVQHVPLKWESLLASSGTSVLVAIVMLSFMIPLKLKFEEKGNLIMVVTVFATVAATYFLSKGAKYLPIDLSGIGAFFNDNTKVIIACGVVLIVAGVLCSMKISEHILEKKEY